MIGAEKKNSWYKTAGICAIFLYIILSARYITLPGIHYDEVLTTIPALRLIQDPNNPWERVPWEIKIGNWTIPVMVMPYMGALKSILLAIAFSIFGINVSALRFTPIVITAFGLFYMLRFSAKAYGWKVAFLTACLISTDPGFILFFKTDFGSVALAFFFRMAALFYLLFWWQTKRLMTLIIAALFLGFGIYDKANFLWFVVALLLAGTWILLEQENRNQVEKKHVLIGGLALLITSSPFWIFNLKHSWITFKMAAMPGQNISLTSLMHSIPIRLRSLLFTLNSQAAYGSMFDAAPVNYWSISQTLLLPLFVISVLLLILHGIRMRERTLIIFPVLIMIMLVEIFLTPRLIWVQHFLAIYPFPQLSIALALAVVLPRLGRSSFSKKLFPAIGTFCFVAAVCTNILMMLNYHRLMKETGGTGPWSDVIYKLADTLNAKYLDRRVIVMDWGINNQLKFLSARKLNVEEFFWFQPTTAANGKMISRTSDPKAVFVVHSPEQTIYPAPRLAIFDAANRLHLAEPKEIRFYDRRSRHVYSILDFR